MAATALSGDQIRALASLVFAAAFSERKQLEKEEHEAKQPDSDAPAPDEIEERIIQEIRRRRDIGREKYGTSMERTDLTTQQWLQHMKEELLDGAIYCERVKRDLGE